MPAFKKVTHATAAETFCGSLNRNQRNHLRAMLHYANACQDLKHALGVAKAVTMSHAEHATGCARRGDTISLFRNHDLSKPADLRVTK